MGGTPKASLRLIADRTAYAPGETARVAAWVDVVEGWHLQSHTPSEEYLIPTELRWTLPAGWAEPRVEYPPSSTYHFEFADKDLAVYQGRVRIVSAFAVPASATGSVPISATLRFQACDDKSCLPPREVSANATLAIGAAGTADAAFDDPGGAPPVAAAAPMPWEAQPAGGAATAAAATPTPAAEPDTAPASTAPSAGRSLPWILVLALFGGLILNVMPCVLPVLSLKVFGLVQSASGEHAGGVRAGALATASGILVSFWVLALAAVGFRAAGAAVGWGVQFQEPAFVIFLTVVVLLFCLNLWGLFELPLPAWLGGVAGRGGARSGLGGHFASGLFATLMATPCSAPFLGTALGFALGAPAAVVLATFTAVGLGMALPYLALAAAPGAARFLPRPGMWMETVRGLMGFLLAGAAVWLLYVLAGEVSRENLALAELGLLLFALFVWLRHRVAGSPALVWGVRLGLVGVLALLATVAMRPGTPPGEGAAAGGPGSIAWVPFDEAQATKLAGEGRLVFVDVTADWCITCKVNEQRVLATAEVADAFARHQVVPMRADWTQRDATIGDFLARHGRYGIPFYVLYRPNAEPHLFSELLTKDAVLGALDGR